MAASLVHPTDGIVASSGVCDLPAMSTGWWGLDFTFHDIPAWLMEAWEDRTIVKRMIEESAFKRVPFER